MKLSKQQVEFIKSVITATDVCSEWKEKVKDTFPELFPNNKEAGWKKSEINPKWLAYYDGKKYIYGIDGYGEWFEKGSGNLAYGSNVSRSDVLATKQEVEKVFVDEAKRRGFKEGVEFINTAGDKVKCFGEFEVYQDYYKDWCLIFGSGNGLIFKSGTWATIIEDEKQTRINELEKQARVILKEIEEIKAAL